MLKQYDENYKARQLAIIIVTKASLLFRLLQLKNMNYLHQAKTQNLHLL